MSRHIPLLLIALLIGGTSLAQIPSNQDCDGSIPVCQDIYFQANSFSGSGNYPNEINGALSCLFTGEFNSVWYTFTVQTSGDVCFTIIPNNSGDDYDWAVFNLTNANCGDIATDSSLEVSCNYDPLGGNPQTGPNGMAGLGFEPCIPVLAGETYAVNLSNFTASADGYTLDFSASSAVILDTIPPQIDSVFTPIACGSSSLDIQFSENILCNTVSAGDFTLVGPSGAHTITTVNGAVCDSGGVQENIYTLSISPPISSSGSYTLSLVGSSGLIEDLCGNVADPSSFTFPLTFVPVLAGNDDTLSFCSSEGPVVLFDSLTGSPDTGGIWLDPLTNVFSGTFDPATDPTGIYTYIVGISPCPTDSSFVLVDTLPPPDAGSNGTLVICDNSPTPLVNGLGGTPTSGGSWTGPGGFSSNGLFEAGVDPAGIYTYQVPPIGSCPGGSASVTVSINPFSSAGTSGSVTLCETDAPTDLFLLLGGSPDPGGSWEDPLGAPVSSTFSPGVSVPGTYIYTVSAVSPCPDPSATVTVTVNSVPDPGTNNTITICTSDAAFDLVTALGGTPDLGGQWTDFFGNPVNNIFDPATGSAGLYIYTVSGTIPCPNASSSLVININPGPSLTLVSQQNLLCNGDTNGSITVSGSGGLAPYTFSLDGGTFGTASSFSGLTGGAHTIELMDANSCLSSLSVTIIEPQVLVPSIVTQNNVSCNGGSDASASFQVTGGTPGYMYSLDGINFFASPVFSNQPAGIHLAVIEDANGCQTNIPVAFIQPEPIVTVFSNPLPIICNGDSTGGFTATAGGGTGPYQYSLDGINFSSNNLFTGLPGGTQTVFILDANGCDFNSTFTVVEPPQLVPSVQSLVNVDCAGGMNGSLTASASGGNAPYQYSLDGTTFSSASTFGSLSVGFYSISIQDASGCIASLDTSISSPTGLLGGVDSLTHPACGGLASGIAELFAQGGTGPYQYSIDGVNFSNNPIFNGLLAGNYSASIQDAAGCLIAFDFSLTAPPTISINIDNQTDVLCNGDSTGSILVSASGGVGVLEYSIDGISFGPSQNFGSLPAGNYTLSVRDSNMCVESVSTSITEPAALVLSAPVTQDVDCFGNSTGSIQLAGSGGTIPYMYGLAASPLSSADTLVNLSAGSYLLVIADANLCTDTLAVPISQPDSLIGSIAAQTNVSCFGGSDGMVSIGVTGGTVAYTYSIDGVNFGAPNTFSSLPAGPQLILIQDANNCLDSVQVSITQPQELDLSLLSQQNVDCNGQSTGSAALSSSGGTQPYMFSMDGGVFQPDSVFQNLSTASYEFIVRDANGCEDTLQLTISEPPLLTITVDSLRDVDCFGTASGVIGVQASGGSGAYQFSIDNGPFVPTSLFNGLTAGNHLLTVQDDSMCMSSITVFVDEPPMLDVQLVSSSDVGCFGGNNGVFEVAGSGGTGSYLFSLDNGIFSPSSIFDTLTAGSYLVTVMDSLSCTATLTVDLQQPDSILGTIDTQTDATCFGASDGSITISGSGGNIPYSYSLDGGLFQASGIFMSLAAGMYQISIQDDSGCVQILPVEIFQPDSLQGILSNLVGVDCHGNLNGRIEMQALGGTAPFLYSIDGLNFQPTGIFSQLAPGSYTIHLQDDNGCQSQYRDIAISEPTPINASVTGVDVLCFGDETGTATVQVEGGTTPYSLVWSDPLAQTGETAIGLAAGSYNVRILDGNGCSARASLSISQPPELIVELLEKQDAHCEWANGSAVVDISGGVGASSVVWTSSPVQSGLILDQVNGGSYYAIGRDANGCVDSLLVEIGNFPSAQASFTTDPPQDTILLSRAQVQFVNQSQDAAVYEWDFGDGVGKSDLPHPVYTFRDTGRYDIRLTAYNGLFLCPDDTTISIVIIPDGRLFIPTAFSPNGDGFNDEFKIRGEGVVSFEIVFFNRWGREIRRYQSMEEGWDGLTSTGGHVPEGVYVYAVKAVLNSGKTMEKGGSVTLLR
ncbi:MAG: gliding motility-associated C-terminal domain-containing protein [Bacteroidota bacterium]